LCRSVTQRFTFIGKNALKIFRAKDEENIWKHEKMWYTDKFFTQISQYCYGGKMREI
jgi:hypothetical protein